MTNVSKSAKWSDKMNNRAEFREREKERKRERERCGKVIHYSPCWAVFRGCRTYQANKAHLFSNEIVPLCTLCAEFTHNSRAV